jgi:hypothetical protein
MTTRHIAAFLVVAAAALSLSCIGADRSPNIRLTTPPGVTVPKIDELRARLEEVLRQPSGTKVYAREGDRWVEVKPPPLPQGLSAVVRSYNEKKGAAYVELAYPQ